MEVLVSLMILAISMTALILSLTELSRNHTYLKEKGVALWVAKNVLTKAELGLLGKNEFKGQEQQLGKDYQWQLKRKPSSQQGVFQLEVTVLAKNKSIISMYGYEWETL